MVEAYKRDDQARLTKVSIFVHPLEDATAEVEHPEVTLSSNEFHHALLVAEWQSEARSAR